MKQWDKCPVCGEADKKHRWDSHAFQVVSEPGEPLALVIGSQIHYDNSHAKARDLAYARAEMKQYFPEKEFEIQPSRMMLRKDGENVSVLGEAHVATYIAYEK